MVWLHDKQCKLDLLGDWRLTVGHGNLKKHVTSLKKIYLAAHLCNQMSVLLQETYTRQWYKIQWFSIRSSTPVHAKSGL